MWQPDLSPMIEALYAALLRQVADAPEAGSVYRRERDGIGYYYAKVPVGAARADAFVGRVDDPGAQARAESLRRGMEEAKERRRAVAMLKGAGLAAPSRALGAALASVAHAGMFRKGAVLVGTAAYLVSAPHLGRRLPALTSLAGDSDLAAADLALSLHGANPSEPMEAILDRAAPGFQAALRPDPRVPAGSRNPDGYGVDFAIRPRRGPGSAPLPPPSSSAQPAPVGQLAWLIEAPVQAVALWGAGVGVAIPRPARFAVHKLIVAQRRAEAERSERARDLAQAGALIAALRDKDPAALDDALADARARGGDQWSGPIGRSLAELAV